jgi:hypothetical protein
MPVVCFTVNHKFSRRRSRQGKDQNLTSSFCKPNTTVSPRQRHIASRILTTFSRFCFNLKITILILFLRRKISLLQQSRINAYVERKQCFERNLHRCTTRIINITITEYRTFSGKINISMAGTGAEHSDADHLQNSAFLYEDGDALA